MGARVRLRVLVIEDDPDIAEALRLLLRSHGYLVEAAASGHDGIQSARRFAPDVVICDIGLPGGPDGFAVAATLRADPAVRDARLIAFTAHSGLDRQSREAGFDEYLIKPTDVDRLLTLVESSARRRRRAQESRLGAP